MKKLLAVLLTLGMLLGLCGAAFALEQKDIEGVWEAKDKGSLLTLAGYTDEYYDALMTIFGDTMSLTMEFTSDNKMITTMSMAGESETMEQTYTLYDPYILVDDGGISELKLEGDQLTITDLDGTELVLVRQGGAAPTVDASNPLVGRWALDIESLISISGVADEFPEEEYQLMSALFAMMTGVMEFTEDGKVTITVSLLGEEDVQESTYEEKNGMVSLEGSGFVPYTIDGDVLTILKDGIALSMTRIVEE